MQMEVPSTDLKRYEHVTLAKNGLRCLLVEDIKAEKSAAAVAVRVGQMQDGLLPGLAHLTGTEERTARYGDDGNLGKR
jgi:secreted Zn-dependent insulinase-like peptidase